MASSLVSVPDADGWVPVERPQPHVEDVQEDGHGIWVIFAKEMEGEKFLVRFPDEPEYRYLDSGIQIEASEAEGDLRLRVEKRVGGEIEALYEEKLKEIESLPESFLLKAKLSADGQMFDLFYRSNEKWVWERVQTTSKLLYTFHTESPDMSGEAHRKFIRSLDVY